MKKPLLIVLACLLCFFAGYFAGIKSKPAAKRFNTPYKMRTIPKRIMPYKKIAPLPGKQKTEKALPAERTNMQKKTATVQNKK